MRTPAESIRAVEERAFALRRHMSDVLALAGVKHPVWSRAKNRRRISVDTLRKIEDALAFLEREQSAAAARTHEQPAA